MDELKVQARLVVVLMFTTLLVGVWWWPVSSTATEPILQVHFLDVGQGDAILVESPSGQQLLVDGGPGPVVLSQLAREMGWLDRSLDVVVASHLDADHIAGLVDVLARYQVRQIVTHEQDIETAVGEAFQRSVANEGAEVVMVRAGQRLDLGAGVVVEVLSPLVHTEGVERNASSFVLQVRYGETEFLLTGDAPKSIEEYLVLTQGENLASEVLKVGHHGSRTSTSELFVATVAPQFAVISAGADNRYGHPHVEVTDVLFNQGVETFKTATAGTVSFKSDGETVWVE